MEGFVAVARRSHSTGEVKPDDCPIDEFKHLMM
jgi:hypothetical protein